MRDRGFGQRVDLGGRFGEFGRGGFFFLSFSFFFTSFVCLMSMMRCNVPTVCLSVCLRTLPPIYPLYPILLMFLLLLTTMMNHVGCAR